MIDFLWIAAATAPWAFHPEQDMSPFQGFNVGAENIKGP